MNIRSIRVLIVCILSLVCSDLLAADEKKVDIEGRIFYSEQGRIFVYLVNEEIFNKPLTGLRTIILEGNPTRAGSAGSLFRFQSVPVGDYGIRCFQDTNDNGKLDRGLFSPAEPWGMSWNTDKPSRWPQYEDITFTADSNLQQISIELK